MKAHHGAMRVGRVARWQRRTTYTVLAACGLTGLVWFLLMDLQGWPPPRLVLWWVGHGITGALALAVIGMALPHHLVATWRHHRNRLLGGLALASLALLALSALLLMYGPEASHGIAHWAHVGIGIAAWVAFPLHVLRGRRSVSKMGRPAG